MGSQKSSSKTRTYYTPAQLRLQEQGLGSVGRQFDQGFFDFGRVAYDRPQIAPYTGAQIAGLQGTALGANTPVDYTNLRAAANASFASRVQNVLGPQLRERAGRLAGYGGDYARAVADPIAEQALNLETYLTGLEANSQEQLRQRQLGLLGIFPQYAAALDPEQAIRQQELTADYQEFLRRMDPSFYATLLGAIPNQLQNTSRDRGEDPFISSLGRAAGTTLGSAVPKPDFG